MSKNIPGQEAFFEGQVLITRGRREDIPLKQAMSSDVKPKVLDEKELERMEALNDIFFEVLMKLDEHHCFHWHRLVSYHGSTLLYAQLNNIGENVVKASEQLEAWDASSEQYKAMKGFIEKAQKACEEAQEWADKMPEKPEFLDEKLQHIQGLLNASQNRLGSQLPSYVTGSKGASLIVQGGVGEVIIAP